MPRQDADTPRVRGPLRSEPSRSDPSHTAPYSWTSIPQLQDTRFPLGMCCLASLTTALAATSKPPPTRPDPLPHGSIFPITPDTYPQNTTLQAPHPTRTAVAADSLTTTSKQASHEGDLDVLRWCALDSLPLCQICYSAIDSNHESRAPAEFLTTRQQLTGRTRVRFAGSQKARVRSSLRVSTRPRSASSSRRTPRWKRGHRRTTTKAY